jgi:hypothetical protein
MALSKTEFQKLKTSLSQKQIQTASKPQGFLQETGEDIRKVGTEYMESAAKRADNVGEILGAKQGVLSKGYQLLGQGAGFASDVFGSTFKGAVKAVLPQKAETAIATGISSAITPIAQSRAVQNLIARYNALDPETKRNVDATIGIGSLTLDLLGINPTAKAVEGTIKTGVNVGKKAIQTVTPKLGRGLKTAGEGLYGVTVTPQEQTIRALVSYDKKQPSLIKRLFGAKKLGEKPITEANTAARRGVTGTEYQIGVQSENIGDDLFKTIIRPKLQAVKNATNIKVLIKNVERKINKIADLGRRKDLKEALSTFSEEYKGLNIVSGERLQKLKEGWASLLTEKSFKTGKPITGAYREIQNMMTDEARPILYKIVGEDGKIAYFDYGNLKSITEAGVKSRLSDAAKRGLFRNAWQIIMDKAVTPVATIGGKILYRTGEGLEFIGERGAKKVKDIIK